MRKKLSILTTLFIVMFVVVSIFPGAKLAESSEDIYWFTVQHRVYLDGRDFTRIMIEFLDELPTSPVHVIELYDPDGIQVDGVTLLSALQFCEYGSFGRYEWLGSSPNPNYYWNWTSIINDNWQRGEYFSWNLEGYTLEVGTYEIRVYLEDGTILHAYCDFTGYVDLPIVSLVGDGAKTKKAKDDSTKKLNTEWLADGSFVLRWDAPPVTTLDTRTQVFIYLKSTPGECDRYVGMAQPTHMGMLIIPPDALNALQCNEDYQGYLAFTINTRTSNSSVRTYSNSHKYYFENIPDCP